MKSKYLPLLLQTTYVRARKPSKCSKLGLGHGRHISLLASIFSRFSDRLNVKLCETWLFMLLYNNKDLLGRKTSVDLRQGYQCSMYVCIHVLSTGQPNGPFICSRV